MLAQAMKTMRYGFGRHHGALPSTEKSTGPLMPRIHSGQILPSGIVTFRRVLCHHNHSPDHSHRSAKTDNNKQNGKSHTHDDHPAHSSHDHAKSHDCQGHDHAHGSGHDHEHAHSEASHNSHSHDHSHEHGHPHEHEHGHSHSHEHGHSHDHGHSHEHEHGHSHSHNHSHSQEHEHGHSHEHEHGHSHCCNGHDHSHGHSHFEESSVSCALSSLGLVKLGSQLGHSTQWMALSIACYAAALLSGRVLAPAQAAAVQAVGLVGTFGLSGFPQLVESLCIAGSGKLDTHVLMTLAVFGTVFLGMAQEGALLLLLFQISHLLEEKLTTRARGSLERLFASVPSQATLVELEPSGAPGMHSARATQASSVNIGQHVLVKPGEQVPLDGCVTWGMASASLQHITGESQPVRMKVGSVIPAGSLNIDGLLVVKVTARADDSTPARIARMAAAAQVAKPKLQRTLDRVGEVWSQAVIACTLATLLLLPLLGVPLFAPQGAFYRAMGVLTAGSPCAIALVPLAYVCALSTITRKGVLMKGAASLDLLDQCDIVALDKTGTLTTGTLGLTDVQVLHSVPSPGARDTIPAIHPAGGDAAGGGGAGAHVTAAAAAAAMQYCLALSLNSNHPVSKAVVSAGKALPSKKTQQVSHFEQVPGLGVSGESRLHPGADPVVVRFGSLEFIKLHLPSGSPAALQLEQAEARQKSVSSSKAMSFLSVTARQHTGGEGNGVSGGQPLPAGAGARELQEPELLAMLCFEDALDPRAPAAVAALKSGSWRRRQGGGRHEKQVVMLTGDGKQVAQHVADQLHISSVHAELKPEDKLAYIRSYQSTGGLLMMGDGINDAPALAAAHVGVALASTPDDLVSAAADVIILNGGGVSNLPWLFKIARDTQNIIKQNIALALLSVIFATLPILAGVFPLWLAVLLHEGATVLVAVSSLRLLLDPQPGSTAGGPAAKPAAAAVPAPSAELETHSHHHHHQQLVTS